ncbi:fumarylacetoacetate hydrolase family protein [Brucella intermedia]|uniref:fumarylacetoacetate hydrolase family protein n=1 Tax=Brucella intermedia TaxID=94625 RepID=UPI00224AB318|nr:fumarylacetoacetate hydrolase family protein [Brucella intermedia]
MAEIRRVIVDGTIGTVEVTNGNFTWPDGRSFGVDNVQHLPPVEPRSVVCVHLNYRSRQEELKRSQPAAPTYFWKSVNSISSHKAKVVRPANCQFLNYEGEIVLVVGRTTRNITPDMAPDYIWGYTVGNDLGLHDFRETDDNSMLRVKGSDTLGPIGPALVTDWDFRNKRIRTYVDGKVVQDGNTEDLIFDPHYLLADLSRTITFQRGDIIFTGTPANSRPVAPGSTVAVEVEGLGRLENPVVSGEWSVPTEYGACPMDTDAIRKIALGSDFKQG